MCREGAAGGETCLFCCSGGKMRRSSDHPGTAALSEFCSVTVRSRGDFTPFSYKTLISPRVFHFQIAAEKKKATQSSPRCTRRLTASRAAVMWLLSVTLLGVCFATPCKWWRCLGGALAMLRSSCPCKNWSCTHTHTHTPSLDTQGHTHTCMHIQKHSCINLHVAAVRGANPVSPKCYYILFERWPFLWPKDELWNHICPIFREASFL